MINFHDSDILVWLILINLKKHFDKLSVTLLILTVYFKLAYRIKAYIILSFG
ncbi:hypothetical protein ACFP3I_04935 [Chryseobacterium arachidis]|uniref:hypothetical protein n=1 Tax=Chryseobacterium arachidis TaxID=1416778 RepID=UPI0036107B87